MLRVSFTFSNEYDTTKVSIHIQPFFISTPAIGNRLQIVYARLT